MITGTGFTFLGFSGGIDSALIAYYLNKLEVDFSLITVAVEGSKEVEIAEKAAELLGHRAHITSFNPVDVEKIIDKALLTIEDYNPMKVSVAIPLLWAAEIAGKIGKGAFFSGNGSDELFGGYQKFVRGYLSKGDQVKDDIYEAVINSHSVNYERDRKIFMDNGLDLKLPFAHIDLIKYALALPVEMKLPKSLSGQRKIILRKLAEKKGLPLEVVNRPKKAIQYSTGVNRVLRKISRSAGMTTEKYLHKRFESIYHSFMSENIFRE
jgi:asparagine synthase (glutamine-hydrolysing)